MKRNLLEQWTRLLELPSAYSRLTVELYESMYPRGSFIAHFNREGFFKARFGTLRDFDETCRMMTQVPELLELFKATPVEVIGQARFKIAAMEAASLTVHARIIEQHVADLQSHFTQPLISK